ncbi:hypothetical protein [Segetibacter koreensis]|uniref:hypothetical protein n=1 Tax=Segetibacter koreensis TaxID=398037 RepID=UPI000363B87A|nr:hypothetical protein [Segetibacter koreensis]
MNAENVEYLQKSLFNLGFGDKLHEELKGKLQQNVPEFTLKTEASFNKEKLEATLYFKKSESVDKYFFNKYDTSLKSDFFPERTHTFYVNKGSAVTFKEAYNLLSGNAVQKNLINKEGEQYKSWLKLDLNQKDENNNYKMDRYHQNYGFDLKKELAKYPIRELNNCDALEMLVKSLEKGNRQSVTFEKNGGEEKFFIRANPKERTIDVFDNHLKPLQAETLKAKFGLDHAAKTDGENNQDLKKDMGKQKELGKDESNVTARTTKSRRMSH